MRKWIPLVLILGALVASAVAWPHMPERVPLHWNARGEPDGFGSRTLAALLMPGVSLLLFGLLRFLPHIDPRKTNIERFAGTYDAMVALLVGAQILIHLVMLGVYVGWPIPIDRAFPAIIGLLLIAIGNLIPRSRSNWWVGVRTPWTMSNERVWSRTNRIGGYAIVAGGFAMLLTAAMPDRFPIGLAIAVTVGAAMVPVVYSYFAWRSLERG